VSEQTCVINLGLKSMRAALFDERGRRSAIAYRPIETHMGEGRVEQEPEDWWRAACEVVGEVLSDHEMRSQTSTITVTSSAGCLVPMARDGSIIRRAIMISDVRAVEQARRIATLPAFLDLGVPGGRVTPDLMLPKVAWMQDEEPDRYGSTAFFLSPNDFLIHRLTGEVATDVSNGGKYFYRRAGGGYPRALLAALGIETDRLPPVVDANDGILAIRPAVADRFGLRRTTRVVLATYDAICAVYGSGVAEVGDACDVSGTVTSFRAVTDRPVQDPSGRLFVTGHVRDDRSLVGGSNNLGGGVVEWAKQVLYPTDADPYATMVSEAADAPPGAAGLTFLPYLLGERSPVWDPNARGVFFGLGRNHTRSDLIRAVFEGVAFSVLDIAGRLRDLGVSIDRVSASGGLARLEPINQMKADMLGVPVRLTSELETTALGAALLAGVARGTWASIDEATRTCVEFGVTLVPDTANGAMYQDFFGVYRELYERLRELFVAREALIREHASVLRTSPVRTENL
jgi:sugar (pentulose or hexulose) kinase